MTRPDERAISPTAVATFRATVDACIAAERRDWEERRAEWVRGHNGLPQNSEVLAPTPRERLASRGGLLDDLSDCVAEYIGDVYGWEAMNDYRNAFGAELGVLADEVPSWGTRPPGDAAQHPLSPYRPSPRAAKALRSIERQGQVYVLSAGGRIKIGYSACLDKRRAQLQRQSPFKLELIRAFPGTMADEAALHRRFAACRVLGEWFEPDAAMQAWLDGLADYRAEP